MATTKKLKMVFVTEDGDQYTLPISYPKEGLTLADAQAAGANIAPAFETTGGVLLSKFQSAAIETTTTEELS